MRRLKLVIRGTVATTGLAAVAALASPSVASLQAPGGFVATCGGISNTTGAVAPGGDLEAFFGGDKVCDWQPFVAGTGSASANFAGSGASNGAQGIAGMGALQLAAHSVSPNDLPFPYGYAQAGWEDSWVISAPGLAGSAGIAHAQLSVDAHWSVSGFAGAAGLALQPYIDSAPFTYPGGGGSTQLQSWNASFFPDGVSQSVLLVVPFVYGQSFDFGVFVTLRAGLRSVSGVAGMSTADAVAGANWLGLSGVFAAGMPVVDYTLVSGSGIDWAGPVAAIPEPPAWVALAAGLVLLALRLRRRGRD
mgnify:CR=1 FL=1